MSCGISAVNAHHAVDKRLDTPGARQLIVSRGAQHSQHVVEVPSAHGLDQCELVREILIERADAHTGQLGDDVGREPVPAALAQNVSRGLEDGFDRRPGTHLLRLFAHGTGARRNASSQAGSPRHNMSIVLAFLERVEVSLPGRSMATVRLTRDDRCPYRERDLPIYLAARFLTEMAALAQSVAIGWTVYLRSNTPLSLGLVGLAQFVPMALLMLPAGELCDRLQPRRILAAGLAVQALCAFGFLALTRETTVPLWPIYPVLILSGAARACVEPASQALLPFLVPPERLPRAIAWGSSMWQLAVITGPALGGLAYAAGAAGTYGLCGAAFLLVALGIMTVAGRRASLADSSTLEARIARVREGVRFVRSQPILLGSISLDLIAVLLGGATALLPVYARDILHAGPTGLGLLRSAPAVGACMTALYQVRHPPGRAVGLKLFAAVAMFGLATVVFALSTSLAVSLAALIAVGATDMVSVNIRASLTQLATPDALRGRVSAVNLLFIGTSSELGAFESGLLASLIGTVPAVLVGGFGALIAAALWMRLFPALRTADRPGSP
jgi:MFS family permease